jgi:hypothetical protein
MRTRLSVFLITLSGLVLEVGLTRIYSASVWYHFAFVAISVALLGWGLGGFTVHILKRVVKLSMNVAAFVIALYALTIPLCLWLLGRFPFEIDRLPLYFLAPLVPFFLAGMALSIVFALHREEAGSLYFADLLGAAIGAVLVTFLLHFLGGEPALLTGAIAPCDCCGVAIKTIRRRFVPRNHRVLHCRFNLCRLKVWRPARCSRDDKSDASTDGRVAYCENYSNRLECLLAHRCRGGN